MQEQQCSHHWEMTNVHPGFIITEKCFKCNKTSTYFSAEDSPPLEEYREGEHFWNVMGSAQSVRFDLKCKNCNTLVPLKELAGMMMCTGCDEKCKVDKLMCDLEKERTWVYVAFGFRPPEETVPLSPEKIAIIEDYFNWRRGSTTSKIKIVSSDMIDDFDTCYAEVIKDIGLLSLTPVE
ncbi:MAG: hypothetical protein K9H64_03275 [Bacteroidales bacterium]|nr:hypothetical protein [Bacteroidales bacterium]MCF8454436.1 hypothetical protein [Bacteroidales bacterium]